MAKILALALLLITFGFSSNPLAQSQSPLREELLKQIEAKRAELQKLEKQLLAPAQEDRAAYAEFLKQPDTGLIRLMPREVFDSETYKDKQKSVTMRGGGAYYSFTRHTHEYGSGSDLELDSNNFAVGFAGAAYGMLVNIGNVPLETVTLEHPGARFMAVYESAGDEPRARVEQERFATGVTVDGFSYKTRLPVAVNTTYLLRSIYYSESDVVVAFRAVRKDADGSVIVVWKLLKTYSKPQLARDNKLAN
jgi:hypothetical protein